MDKPAEFLIRSALHDLANVLAGIRGILDLGSADEPMGTRDRDRLEAVLDEGLATLERTRFLAMGQCPATGLEPGDTWRAHLREELQPLAVIFRTTFELTPEGEPGTDQWPGPALRSFVRAATRQVLPYVRTGRLSIRFEAREAAWTVRWDGVNAIPENLLPIPDDRPKDIASRWAAELARALDITFTLADGALAARVPRPRTSD